MVDSQVILMTLDCVFLPPNSLLAFILEPCEILIFCDFVFKYVFLTYMFGWQYNNIGK